MRILHSTPYFAPAWAYGGTPRAVFELAKQQHKQGHDVWVITTDAFEDKKRITPLEESIEGINVIRLPNLSNRLSWKMHFCTPNPFSWPADIGDFDVIHLHEVRSFLHLLVLNKIKTKNIVLSPWGTLDYNDSKVWIKKLLDILFISKIRAVVKIGIGQTSHELKVLNQFKIGKKNLVIPLGVDISIKKAKMEKIKARKKLKLPTDKKIFMFLGRFSRLKGLELLLKTFSFFQQKHSDCILVIIGRDDGYLEKMKSLIATLGLEMSVTILDPLYGKDRVTGICAADYFIFTPIVFEETGTACLEALVCGIPVISTKEAEIPFLNQRDGFQMVESNPKAILKAMEIFYKKSPIVPADKIEKLFSWMAISKEMTEIYEKGI